MPLTQLPQMCTTTVQVPKLRTVVNIVRHCQSVDGVAIVIRCPLTSLFCPGSHPESHLPWVVTPPQLLPNCDSSQFVGTMTLWKSTGPWLRRKSLNLDLFSPDYSRVLHFGHGFPDTRCRALPGPWEAARGLEYLSAGGGNLTIGQGGVCQASPPRSYCLVDEYIWGRDFESM